MPERASYLFLCDDITEGECLNKQLVGCGQTHAPWPKEIRKGDYVYLLNYRSRTVRGPYAATSTADCHDSLAWAGRFPVQVRIVATRLTRKANSNQSVRLPSIFLRKLLSQRLNTEAGAELFSWLQQVGVPSDLTQISIIGIELQELTKLVDEFTKHLNELKFDPATKRKVAAQIATLKAQLDDPDPVIVRQAGCTLRILTEGAIAGRLTAAAQSAVWHWINETLKSFK